MEALLVGSLVFLWMLLMLNLLLTLGLARRVRGVLPTKALLQVGENAPEFSAQTLEGEKVTLATYLRSALALVFVSPQCKPCRDGLPTLKRLAVKARQSGSELILVSDGDSTETLSLIGEDSSALCVVVAPRGQTPLLSDYKVMSTPSFYLLDARGRVHAAGVGLDGLERGMERLLSRSKGGGKQVQLGIEETR